MTAKAWQVTADDYEGSSALVFAETAGQAKRLGAQDLDEEFTAVRVRRAPAFDGLTPADLCNAVYLARGWWVWCCGCFDAPVCDSEAVHGEGDAVYCSEACRAKKEGSGPA